MNKIALVTGGTRGIGAAISKSLHGAGLQVIASYAGNEDAAKKFSAETGIPTKKFDVSDFTACKTALTEIENEFGAVDILINNAGVTRDGFFHKMTEDQWNTVIQTNLTSLFNVTRPVIEGMRGRGFGRVVNISSINGQKGQAGQANYSAAKAGVIGFTKALAMESAAKNITVNCICPGYIATEMVSAIEEKVLDKIIACIPAGRLGEAEEIAGLVNYLVSDKAGFMNGSVLSINGAQLTAN